MMPINLELLTAKEVCGLLKMGRTTLWRWVNAGVFPAPRSVGPKCIRWTRAEVEAWIDGRTLAKAGLKISADLCETQRNTQRQRNSTNIKLLRGVP